ncbi:hypothetical protein AB0B56_28640 [Streptosporangium canum]|uniref:hypothetical protein n=1 Tax=Streptosporangium canum TaxID=324952 RepID=UPI003444E2CC
MTLLSRLYGVRPALRHRVLESSPGRYRYDAADPTPAGRGLRASEHEIFHDHRHPSARRLPFTSGAS